MVILRVWPWLRGGFMAGGYNAKLAEGGEGRGRKRGGGGYGCGEP